MLKDKREGIIDFPEKDAEAELKKAKKYAAGLLVDAEHFALVTKGPDDEVVSYIFAKGGRVVVEMHEHITNACMEMVQHHIKEPGSVPNHSQEPN